MTLTPADYMFVFLSAWFVGLLFGSARDTLRG